MVVTRDTGRVLPGTGLCEPGRALPLPLWFAVPVLFVASVAGLTGTASLALGIAGGQLPMSTEVFGAAAAVTLVLSGGVRSWRKPVRRVLSWLYPLAVLALGIGLSWLAVPTGLAVAVGLPATAAAVALCVWARGPRPEESRDRLPTLV
ncbi:hypothetical protein KALB_7624 [Kutzneria albida DSM 43870]|uniref:Uncharacterized protein n=1 Tax=Kutzneria albida DSM 43870 TaxID=1449976 RepID=W5WK78_9PSEU|nr:hypothetical protein KALB_7624 [Kutzneria albida DSM 43870]